MHDAMVLEAVPSWSVNAAVSMQQMPLSFLRPGEMAQVIKVRGADETRRHLEDIGFHPGTTVRVVTEQAGNIIVEVKGASVALDRASAQKVITG